MKALEMKGYTMEVKELAEHTIVTVFYPNGCYAFAANIEDVDTVADLMGL